MGLDAFFDAERCEERLHSRECDSRARQWKQWCSNGLCSVRTVHHVCPVGSVFYGVKGRWGEVWMRAVPSAVKTSNTWLEKGFWLPFKHKLLLLGL